MSREAADKRRAQRLTDWIARGCPPSPTIPPKPKRRHEQASDIRPILLRILSVQRGRCIGCGETVDPADKSADRRLSVDHVHPRVLGGGNVGNRLVMHRVCNCRKGRRLPNGCELVWLAAVNASLEVKL